MKKAIILGAGSLALLLAMPAMAADVPVKAPALKAVAAPATPIWDVAFGGAVMTDYIFRGMSQSNRSPSANAYFEGQYNGPFGQLYAGISGSSIDWPINLGFTDPAAEIDLYGGWRPNKIGKLSTDFGYIYYYYPKENFVVSNAGAPFGYSNSDFWEIYAKATYDVTDKFTVGTAVWYSPSVLNYSMSGVYWNGTFKWVLPDLNPNGLGWYLSGELGHWWLGTTDINHANPVGLPLAFDVPDLTYWNAGVAFTYKVLTLDLRYHGTDYSKTECGQMMLVTSTNSAAKWCGSTFVAKLSVDSALSQLK